MPSAASKRGAVPALIAWHPGLWRLSGGAFADVVAGVVDRTATLETLRARAECAGGLVHAEQIHGASIAALEMLPSPAQPITGCDALMTSQARCTLIIRTADCLPLYLWDAAKRVIGLAHVGWRGLAKQLPMRLANGVRTWYHSRMDDIWWGFGPAIRACCYEVGPEFEPRFGRFVRISRKGRRTFDLAGAAIAQLRQCGVRPERVIDTGVCTACEADRWFSVRREGDATGRLYSFISR